MSPEKQRPYTIFTPPSLSSSELICTTLDHDTTDVLIDKWLGHRTQGDDDDVYQDWFFDLRSRKNVAQDPTKKQIVAWNKGDFVPENIFCRTVDTGRLLPLDRTWTTRVYHHKSMSERKLSMMPVVFTMLPELMLLRGMHDTGCDDIYIIVTDLKRQEMDDATAYLQLSLQYAVSGRRKTDIEQQMQYEYMCLKNAIAKQKRLPCFPQIDLTLRAILYEKRPRFVILFSHQTSSYSQIFFTHQEYVPDPEIFFDYPTGCPNPCCTEDCEMVKFPRRGADGAVILSLMNHKRRKIKFRRKEMCNWIDCNVCFGEPAGEDHGDTEGSAGSTDEAENSPLLNGSTDSRDITSEPQLNSRSARESSESKGDEVGNIPNPVKVLRGQVCGKCKLVRYCCQEHQLNDWPEHKRVCMKPVPMKG